MPTFPVIKARLVEFIANYPALRDRPDRHGVRRIWSANEERNSPEHHHGADWRAIWPAAQKWGKDVTEQAMKEALVKLVEEGVLLRRRHAWGGGPRGYEVWEVAPVHRVDVGVVKRKKTAASRRRLTEK